MSRGRWRLGAIFASVAFACVPAADETTPKGAIGIETLPSAAARGEPIVTSDGWTIRIESLALQMYVVAVPDDGLAGGLGGTYTFAGAKPEEIIIRAIPQGTALISMSLVSRTVADGYDPIYNGPNDTTRVSFEVDARFNKPADDAQALLGRDLDSGAFKYDTTEGPTIVLVARAEKAGRVIRLDTAIEGSPSPLSIGWGVRANDLAKLNLTIAPERLFLKNGQLVFDDIARADIDNDGIISLNEMRRLDIKPCPRCSPAEKLRLEEEAKTRTVLALLGDHVSDLLVPGL